MLHVYWLPVDRSGNPNGFLIRIKLLRRLKNSKERIMNAMKPTKPEPCDGQRDALKVNYGLYKMDV